MRLIIQSIKVLEIKSFMLFNLDFANNTIFSCFCFLFLIVNLYFLIFAAIAPVFNFITELVIPIEVSNRNEAKAETEIHPVIAEAKIRTFSI